MTVKYPNVLLILGTLFLGGIQTKVSAETQLQTTPVYRLHADLNHIGVVMTVQDRGWVLSRQGILAYDINPYFSGILSGSGVERIFKLDGALFRVYNPNSRPDLVNLFECKRSQGGVYKGPIYIPQADQYTSTDVNCEQGSYVGYREYLGAILSHPEAGHIPVYRYFSAVLNKHITSTNPLEILNNPGFGFSLEGILGYAPMQ